MPFFPREEAEVLANRPVVYIHWSVYIAAMARDARTTREQIIQAADALFYGEGIRSASMDAIAAKASVTKRTIYYHFPSKDDLIAAYLTARDEPTFARQTTWLDETKGDLPEQVLGLFENLARAMNTPRWKGCGFIRAAAELAGAPGHPALKIGSAHKKRVEAWLEGRIATTGLSEPALRARQVMILLDGAAAQVLIHRDPAYALAAGQAAAALVTKNA
jgi:AcrR family transcriptional regulator